MGHAFNFQGVWDQQMPTASGSILYGQVTSTACSTTVTGLNTNFTRSRGRDKLSDLRQRLDEDPVPGHRDCQRHQPDNRVPTNTRDSGTTTARMITDVQPVTRLPAHDLRPSASALS